MPSGYLKNTPGESHKKARGGGSHPNPPKKTSAEQQKDNKQQQHSQAKASTDNHLEQALDLEGIHNMSSASSAAANKKRNVASAFRDGVDAEMANADKMQLGENASPEFTDKGVGSNVLALSQMVRKGDPSRLARQILASDDAQQVADLMVLLFVTRNARGGKGERDLSYQMLLCVWDKFPETAKALLKLFSHYGYWKDYLLLSVMAQEQNHAAKDAILKECVALMRAQLDQDHEAVLKYEKELEAAKDPAEKAKMEAKGPSISLLAKWLPRENTSFDKKLGFVDAFTTNDSNNGGNGGNNGDGEWKSRSKASYRKLVAKLTAFLELPEVLLSAQRADEINLHKLASKATLRLSRALLNETKDGSARSEDPKRIKLAEKFVEHLSEKGLKGGQVMPHEIVREVLGGKPISPSREKVLDAQWKDLRSKVVEQVEAKAKEEGLDFNPTRMVPLSDVSGSMYGVPIEVAVALGILISEITHPAFQDMVLTFESQPRWHRLNSGDSIVKKVRSLAAAPWGGSTNFEGAYDRILEVCVKNRLAREDVPSLIVFSDMQFNVAQCGYSYGAYGGGNARMTTMHDTIKQKFANVAAKLGWMDNDPTPIVYWNLRTTGGHPVDKDTGGAVLLSGFSPSLLKLVMNGEALKEEEVEIVEKDGTVRKEKVRVTPEEVLRKMLDDPLYDPVRNVLAESTEGLLGDYEPPVSMLEGAPKDGDFELL